MSAADKDERSLVPRPKGELAKGGEEPKSTELEKRGWQEAIKPRLLCSLHGHFDRVSVTAWSPDGTRLASGRDTVVWVWDVARGEVTHTLKGHTDIVAAIAWSPDGTMIASGDHGLDVRVWDANTGEQIHRFSEPDGVSSIAWSPDGSRLAVGTVNALCDGTRAVVRLWDVASEEEIHALMGPGFMGAVAWGIEGDWVASCGLNGILGVWDPGNGSELHGLQWWSEGLAQSVAWSADGARFASGHQDAAVRVWEAGSGKELTTLEARGPVVRAIAWSPDGIKLASAGGWGKDSTRKFDPVTEAEALSSIQDDEGTVWVWNSETGWGVGLSGLETTIRGISWSPDGNRLAICDGGMVGIWSITG